MIEPSLAMLTDEQRRFLEHWVIFPSLVYLPKEVLAVYLELNADKVDDLVRDFERFSLLDRVFEDGHQYTYRLHGLLLDALRIKLSTTKQEELHGKFFDTYERRFGRKSWSQLAKIKGHRHFWVYAPWHLLRAERLNQVLQIFLDLQFLQARLVSIGSSSVIVDFREFRHVFIQKNRLQEW
ncbi:wD repeat domain [Cichlidogyrus casuarinus]|uniref:WD repeat domain n=1 Tax=Cichlidogyrus casuarinus TaxID=1844966 RepID=A0ABD2QP44_9PLAT